MSTEDRYPGVYSGQVKIHGKKMFGLLKNLVAKGYLVNLDAVYHVYLPGSYENETFTIGCRIHNAGDQINFAKLWGPLVEVCMPRGVFFSAIQVLGKAGDTEAATVANNSMGRCIRDTSVIPEGEYDLFVWDCEKTTDWDALEKKFQ